MDAETEWAVALLARVDGRAVKLIPYPDEATAKEAAETWHLHESPLVISRTVNPWRVDSLGNEVKLTEFLSNYLA